MLSLSFFSSDKRIAVSHSRLKRRRQKTHRVKYPTIRKGWKEWADAGFPVDANGVPDKKYFHRGEDSWVRVPWDEVSTYAAKGLLHVMNKYPGKEGAQKLKAQGYPEEMIEAMQLSSLSAQNGDRVK